MVISPKFYVDLETAVDYRIENRYAAVAQNLVYDRWTKVQPSTSLKVISKHRLPYVTIQDEGETGGSVNFDDIRILETSGIVHYFKTGLELTEQQASDLDEAGIAGGEAIRVAVEWAGDLAAAEAYLPQKLSTSVLRGIDPDTGLDVSRPVYDGKELFATDHPIHPGRTDLGTWANKFSGAPSGLYPGFQPLAGPFAKNGSTGEWEYSADSWVSVEDGRRNLYKVLAYIRSITLPDGKTPAFMGATTIGHSPFAKDNVQLITRARYIAATASGGGGGSQDVEGMLVELGQNKPIEIPELAMPRYAGGAALAARECWDYYLFAEADAQRSSLGLIQYRQREPFSVKFFSGANTFQLAVTNKLVWVAQARSGCWPAVPYFGFQVQAPRP